MEQRKHCERIDTRVTKIFPHWEDYRNKWPALLKTKTESQCCDSWQCVWNAVSTIPIIECRLFIWLNGTYNSEKEANFLKNVKQCEDDDKLIFCPKSTVHSKYVNDYYTKEWRSVDTSPLRLANNNIVFQLKRNAPHLRLKI